jgi:hypothetical protein
MPITIATDEFNPRAEADVTYTICINERQLHYLRRAMSEFVQNDPGWEEDESEQDIPTALNEMLAGDLARSPYVNGFVL